MIERKANTFRLYPTIEQERQMARIAGTCRFVYNLALEQRRDWWRQHKDAYYPALRQTQGTLRAERTEWQPWLDYFIGALRSQKRALDEKIRREKIVLDALPPLSVHILDIARTQGRVTVAEAAKITGTSRNTVKDHLKALTDGGHLARHGAGRGSWYALS